jgi:hypothetical protein
MAKQVQSGSFGPNGEGGYWATCWDADGNEYNATGLTREEAERAALDKRWNHSWARLWDAGRAG